jgi:ABC-type multidrug transport system, ATPase and permease components
LAIIGSTGSGKSSIINLILRFYDATKGEILINDINIKEYDLHHLHEIFGYVSQKAMLFKGSIKHNVLYGKINKDNILDTALKISQSSSFVNKLENKENYEVAQGGTNLSGGQKQRLSIARAIAKNPEIYLFDDSFSALDYATDFNLRKELKKHTSSATNIIVAQRIGTIINSDKILVLEKGKVVGLDNHKNLLNKCSVYKEIAYSQLSKEELENA